jgi:transmembrane sensor
MAAAGLAAVALGLTTFVTLQSPASYETAVGDRRVVTLADGSRLSLDSDSEVHVRYSRDERALVLDRGRARFDVTHDISRPFTVVVGNEKVVAVGTSFDVERLGEKIMVTLLEGRVVVDAVRSVPYSSTEAKTVPASISLSAGQQLVVAAATVPAVSEANLQTAKAWEAGTLVFDDEPLSEAAVRVNRYSKVSVTVDPEASNVRISGVFNAGDVASFVDAVSTYFPIEVSMQKNRYVLRARR